MIVMTVSDITLLFYTYRTFFIHTWSIERITFYQCKLTFFVVVTLPLSDGLMGSVRCVFQTLVCESVLEWSEFWKIDFIERSIVADRLLKKPISREFTWRNLTNKFYAEIWLFGNWLLCVHFVWASFYVLLFSVVLTFLNMCNIL